ncbi:anthranilate synthase component II [Venturia nashicola]|uniref:Anthranilate synthase component II n=1 Tax=Venturia nashicola TaxID=86259 RepID=A0A4Z1PJ30_9PEZI|nr:anthranilate synthase component II [Venturia nashicola]TLD35162.1 anthranilate synthase component II [Venturia nashicola]
MSAAHTLRATGSKHEDRVRMLVLETDQTFEETAKRKGSFGQIFHDLFSKAGQDHDPPLEIETLMKFIVEPEGGKLPTAEEVGEVDAVLITGSNYDAHGDDEWILKLIERIRTAWKEKPNLRFSGVCFGHQVLCRALGSTVEPSPGEKWELSHTEIELSPIGEALFRTKGSIDLHQMHVDHVVQAPSSKSSGGLIKDDSSVHIWGSSKDIPIQGVYIQERLFTSQGHLGYDEKMVEKHIQHRVEKGLIKDKEQAEDAKQKAHLDHDGILVASAILRFFHGEDRKIS